MKFLNVENFLFVSGFSFLSDPTSYHLKLQPPEYSPLFMFHQNNVKYHHLKNRLGLIRKISPNKFSEKNVLVIIGDYICEQRQIAKFIPKIHL